MRYRVALVLILGLLACLLPSVSPAQYVEQAVANPSSALTAGNVRPELKLTEIESLRARVVGLEMALAELLRDRCFPNPSKPARFQVEEHNKAIERSVGQLKRMENAVLKAHSLDPEKYQIDWKGGRIEEKR